MDQRNDCRVLRYACIKNLCYRAMHGEEFVNVKAQVCTTFPGLGATCVSCCVTANLCDRKMSQDSASASWTVDDVDVSMLQGDRFTGTNPQKTPALVVEGEKDYTGNC